MLRMMTDNPDQCDEAADASTTTELVRTTGRTETVATDPTVLMDV
jgi:hypothetical protein